jgi:hypothetical protein
MFFLLRMMFWLTVVCVLLPSSGGNTAKVSLPVDTLQAVSAAGAAYSDMRGFCERQADACIVGGQVASVIGQRATEGAKTIAEFISHQMADTPQAQRKNQRASQDTLTPVDTTPAFRIPAAQVPMPVASPRREAQNRRPSA